MGFFVKKDEAQTKRINEQVGKIVTAIWEFDNGQGSFSNITALLDEVYEWGILDERFGPWEVENEPVLIERVDPSLKP